MQPGYHYVSFIRIILAGSTWEHINAHYERLRILKTGLEKQEYLGIWALLQGTVNQNAKKKPVSIWQLR